MTNKGEILRRFLEERGVRLHPGRMGWQKVSCFGPAHGRGDRNPSASVNLTTGHYRCFACDLSGDAYDLLQVLEGLTFKQALATLGGAQSPSVEPETWL